MAEVLSQSQIDSLLSGLTAGELDAAEIEKSTKSKKILNYDFRTPTKFTKEQIRTLYSVHEIYARHLSSYFTGTLRTLVNIELASVEETRYYEFNNALSESVLLGVIELKPLDGSVLIVFSKDITYTIIDKLLGGEGNPLVFDRDFSEIELVLMERVIKQIIKYFKESWRSILEVEPVFKQLETNSRLTQLLPIDEIVAIIVYNVTIRDITGTISICIPYISLESIIEQLNAKNRFAIRGKPQADNDEVRKSVLEQIKNSYIELHAVLGETTISMHDLLKIQVGDVIQLNHRINEDVKVNIGNRTWFSAEPGIKNNKKALRITNVLE